MSVASGPVVKFVPGEAVAVIGRRLVALVDADQRSDLVKVLSLHAQGDTTLGDLVDDLAPLGLRNLPPFAAVVLDGSDCGVLARGDIVVALGLDEGRGEVTVSGRGVASWVEHHERGVASLLVHLADDLSEVGMFEIAAGLVPASRLTCTLPIDVVNQDAPDPVTSDPTPHSVPAATDPELEPVEEVDPDTPMVAAVGHRAGVPPPFADNATIKFAPDAFEIVPEDPAALDDDLATPVEPSNGEPDSDYDHLFGATQFRPVSAAGVHVDRDAIAEPGASSRETDGLIAWTPATAPDGAGAVGGPDDHGDHDGFTISLAQLREMQASESTISAAPGGSEQASTPLSEPGVAPAMVHAVHCSSGHPNPPSATVCRACGIEIPAQSHATVPRPKLGRFRFSDGREVTVARPMLLGRSPKADGPVSGELPELVALDSPTKEVSGTHLEIRIEGWQVLVVDRQSTNGSTVRLPQREPRRLHPGEPFPIIPGSVVELAGEVSFVFEVVL